MAKMGKPPAKGMMKKAEASFMKMDEKSDKKLMGKAMKKGMKPGMMMKDK
jgi:hypothetical protein